MVPVWKHEAAILEENEIRYERIKKKGYYNNNCLYINLIISIIKNLKSIFFWIKIKLLEFFFRVYNSYLVTFMAFF